MVMTLTEQMFARVPGNPLADLRRADQRWLAIRTGSIPVPKTVTESTERLGDLDWDVVICGGTLGILLGTALAQLGWRVAVLERGPLRGRAQEWNISRRELGALAELGLLTSEAVEGAIASEYNPGRIAFGDGPEFWIKDVLNVGVDPVYLLERLKDQYLAAGGALFENTSLESVTVHEDGVRAIAQQTFEARLLLDMMGHFSPIAQQSRGGQRPDSMCLVVGSCARGFSKNDTGDLFVSFTPAQNQCQYFWEAFPARDGRTTYLFTYVDTHPKRPSLEELFEVYWQLLPDYQDIELSSLEIERVLFGLLPAYRNSPLMVSWDRILHLGDSSGGQSPLSFSGFGAIIRHLPRLRLTLHNALQTNGLRSQNLRQIQSYQPNIAVTWLFQSTMSIGINQSIPPNQINRLLATVFQEMDGLGEEVIRPFLQDVVQFSGLSRTLLKTGWKHPRFILSLVPQLGLLSLLSWMGHYLNLGVYTVLFVLGQRLQPWINTLSPSEQHRWQCRLQTWRYGSGKDYDE